MNDSQISARIIAIRAAAGAELGIASADRCPICGRAAASPARRLVNGAIVEGCIDAHHTGHLAGADLAWHTRPCAKQWRAETARSLAA